MIFTFYTNNITHCEINLVAYLIFKHTSYLVYIMNIIILAGGDGKRMNSSTPKILHLFLGVPMLINIILIADKLQSEKILVVTGKYYNEIKYVCENNLESSVKNKLIYVQQPHALGTGNAVKHCLPYLNDYKMTLILNGDMPAINVNFLQEIIKEIELLPESVTKNFVVTATIDNPYGYGRIISDKNNIKDNVSKIKYIVEEKEASDEEKSIKNINTGIYYINSNTLIKYVKLIDNKNEKQEYYLTDIVKICNEHNEDIYEYTISPNMNVFVKGVNTQQQLIELESEFS